MDAQIAASRSALIVVIPRAARLVAKVAEKRAVAHAKGTVSVAVKTVVLAVA